MLYNKVIICSVKEPQDCSKEKLLVSLSTDYGVNMYIVDKDNFEFPSQELLVRKTKCEQLECGKYKHFKGKTYEVQAIVEEFNHLEIKYVFYKQLEESDFPAGTRWIRPYDEFFDIHPSGEKRFVKID